MLWSSIRKVKVFRNSIKIGEHVKLTYWSSWQRISTEREKNYLQKKLLFEIINKFQRQTVEKSESLKFIAWFESCRIKIDVSRLRFMCILQLNGQWKKSQFYVAVAIVMSVYSSLFIFLRCRNRWYKSDVDTWNW